MERVPFKIYPLVGPQPTWNDLINRIDSVPAVDANRKIRWRQAIEFLRAELGTGFFNNCGNNHPIYIKLTNAPWLLNDLIDFANTLKTLKNNDSNYSYLLTKIRPRNKCRSEGAAFVEIASTFLKQGFQIKFLENSNSRKSPDIEISDPITDNKFFVEVSRVNDSTKRKQTNDEFRVISNTLLHYGFNLLYSYKQLKHLGKEGIDDTIERIKSMKDEASANESFLVYRSEIIDLAVAHHHKYDELMKWCEENGRTKGATGLSVDFNDTPRIVDYKKIHKKVKQIPPGETGILHMPIHFLYFFAMNIEETIIRIMDEISHYPNLLGVILTANLGQPVKEEFIEVGNTIRSVQMVNDIARHLLFIYNYQYKGNLTQETWQKIRSCFLVNKV
jgi:hypothetical protein